MITSIVYLDIDWQSITAIFCRISVSIALLLLLAFYNYIFFSMLIKLIVLYDILVRPWGWM